MGNFNSCISDEKYKTLSKSKQNNYYPKLVRANIQSRDEGINEYNYYPYLVYEWYQAKKGEDLKDQNNINRKIIRDAYKEILEEIIQKARDPYTKKFRVKQLNKLEDPDYFPESDKK